MKMNHKMLLTKMAVCCLLTIPFFATGCAGVPDPVELDGGSAITINQELIRKQNKGIPLDPFLKEHNWTYNIVFEKIGNEYIPNNQIVKSFYVAHNANKIIIIGNKDLAQDYKQYFEKNGVKNIEIHEVLYINENANKVNVLFFGKKIKSN